MKLSRSAEGFPITRVVLPFAASILLAFEDACDDLSAEEATARRMRGRYVDRVGMTSLVSIGFVCWISSAMDGREFEKSFLEGGRQ